MGASAVDKDKGVQYGKTVTADESVGVEINDERKRMREDGGLVGQTSAMDLDKQGLRGVEERFIVGGHDPINMVLAGRTSKACLEL